MKKILTIILFAIQAEILHADSILEQQGKVAGAVVFSAMSIDWYMTKCLSKGVRLNNNLTGVDTILNRKNWGFQSHHIQTIFYKRYGRDINKEAETMVDYFIKKFKGCESEKMGFWINELRIMHEKAIDDLHKQP